MKFYYKNNLCYKIINFKTLYFFLIIKKTTLKNIKHYLKFI